MISYQLLKTANQKFNTNIGDNNFEFDIHSYRGVIYISVSVNGVLMDVNAPGLPNRSLFNGLVNNMAGGVFMFKTDGDFYPSFDKFDGVACDFVYIPNEEL